MVKFIEELPFMGCKVLDAGVCDCATVFVSQKAQLRNGLATILLSFTVAHPVQVVPIWHIRVVILVEDIRCIQGGEDIKLFIS